MKNTLRTLAVMLVLFNLTGCGLKGPLYFPPADNKAPAPAVKSQTVQPVEPSRNDRAQTDGPTQVISQ